MPAEGYPAGKRPWRTQRKSRGGEARQDRKGVFLMDIVEYRSLDKKERLLLAAEEIFAKQGYSQTTLDEIIALADTGKGTLYKYFGSKDNLFYTLISMKHGELMETLNDIAFSSEEIEERIRQIVEAWIRFLLKNTVLWQVLCFAMTGSNQGFRSTEGDDGELKLMLRWGKMPSEKVQREILRYHVVLNEEALPLEYVFREGMESGFFKETVPDARIAKQVFFSLAMIVFSRTALEQGVQDPKALAGLLTRHLLYGIRK